MANTPLPIATAPVSGFPVPGDLAGTVSSIDFAAIFGNILLALAILAVGALLIRLSRKLLEKSLGRSEKVNGLLRTFILSSYSKVAWILLGLIVVQRLGINIAPMLAGLGVTGFILGFAFQETLGNLAAGLMLSLNHPFSLKDYVRIDGIEGTVLEVNMMATTLATSDNKKVVVPNKRVWGAAITNFTAFDTRRVEISVGIAYGEDISEARAVILRTLAENPLVLKEPLPSVEVVRMGDSSVDFAVRPWVRTGDYWTVFFRLNQEVKEALDRAGIGIPFPRMDIHMISDIKKS